MAQSGRRPAPLGSGSKASAVLQPPEPKAAQSAETRLAVQAEQVRLAYGAPVVLSINLVNAAVAAALLWSVYPTPVLFGWLMAMACAVLARLTLWSRFRRGDPKPEHLPVWGGAFVLGAIATGMLWGALASIVLVTDDPAYYVFVAFLLGGMTAGSALQDSAYLPAFYGFTAPAVLPMIAAMLLRHEPVLWEMGLLMAAFALVLMLTGRGNHRWITRTITLRLEQARLNAELQRAGEKLAELALHDPLTGLFNRRYVAETLPREIHRAVRDRARLVVALLDVDHFKSFNDSFGHAAGDLALRMVGEQLRRGVRAGDIACRYGGEEFLVVLAECDALEAKRRLGEVCRRIRREPLQFEGRRLPAVTLSVGVAELSTDLVEAEALIAAADAALYAAKKSGRDRIVAHRAAEADAPAA